VIDRHQQPSQHEPNGHNGRDEHSQESVRGPRDGGMVPLLPPKRLVDPDPVDVEPAVGRGQVSCSSRGLCPHRTRRRRCCCCCWSLQMLPASDAALCSLLARTALISRGEPRTRIDHPLSAAASLLVLNKQIPRLASFGKYFHATAHAGHASTAHAGHAWVANAHACT
jgi:hypothetical protein